MVCDFDETIFSYDVATLRKELEYMKKNNYTILLPNSFDIVGDALPKYEEGKFLHELCKYGRNNAKYYAKPIIFNPNEIQEIQYCLGAHYAQPIGNVKWYKSKNLFMIHAKYLSFDFYYNKIKNRQVSERNNKMGIDCEKKKTLEDMRLEFDDMMKDRFKWVEIKDNYEKYYEKQ